MKGAAELAERVRLGNWEVAVEVLGGCGFLVVLF